MLCRTVGLEGPCLIAALTGKAGRRHAHPHRHTRPCRSPLSAASRPAFGSWQAYHPSWRPGCGQMEKVVEGLEWAQRAGGKGVRHASSRLGTHPCLQSEPGGTDPCSVVAQRSALASGSGGQCLPWLAARLPLFTPACAPTPHQSSHSLRPNLLT